MPDCVDKICLGTVKLGVPEYGFSSRGPDRNCDPLRFLQQVETVGISRFDTSPRYGQSEEVLGEYLAQTAIQPLVSSKIDELKTNDPGSPEKMVLSVRSSLQRLNIQQLDICYLHQNELEIISDPYIHEGLQQLKELKLIVAAGASLYSHAECDYALSSGLFDVIQVPVSVFDLSFYQQFIKNNSSDVRFSARSLLLQGVLADRHSIAGQIKQADSIQSYLQQLDGIAGEYSLPVISMALRFVGSLAGLDHCLVGTTSVGNLLQTIQCMSSPLPEALFSQLVSLAEKPKIWTNPRNWSG